MSEKEKKTMENLAKILPELPDFEKGRLLGYGERMAEEKETKEAAADDETDA